MTPPVRGEGLGWGRPVKLMTRAEEQRAGKGKGPSGFPERALFSLLLRPGSRIGR